jgi:hypothetical protein
MAAARRAILELSRSVPASRFKPRAFATPTVLDVTTADTWENRVPDPQHPFGAPHTEQSGFGNPTGASAGTYTYQCRLSKAVQGSAPGEPRTRIPE